MASKVLWRRFRSGRWILAGLLVYCFLYAVYWWCAVYRLNHDEIRPKLRLAAEMLSIEESEGDTAGSQEPRGDSRRRLRDLVAGRFKRVTSVYGPKLTFYPPDEGSPPLQHDEYDRLQDVFIEKATDLAMTREGTRGFAEAFLRLKAVGDRWKADTPRDLSWYEKWRRNDHTRRGASFGIPLPFNDAGSLREGAREYLRHYRDFDLGRKQDVERESALATGLPASMAPADTNGNLRHLSRFINPSLFHRPWNLLRWSNPSFYHNATRHPFAILTLVYVTFFFLGIRYAGCDDDQGASGRESIFTKAGAPVRPLRWRWGARIVSVGRERFWLAVGGCVAASVLAVEAHETWPEWVVSFTMIPLTALLVPLLIGSLAAMANARLSDAFLRLPAKERIAQLTGFSLAAAATVGMSLWLAYYSVFGLLLSFDPGRVARGLIQFALAGLVLYWLGRLILNVFGTPGKSPTTDPQESADFAQGVVGRVLEGALIALLPVAATWLPTLLDQG
jgi:hypothetical protein